MMGAGAGTRSVAHARNLHRTCGRVAALGHDSVRLAEQGLEDDGRPTMASPHCDNTTGDHRRAPPLAVGLMLYPELGAHSELALVYRRYPYMTQPGHFTKFLPKTRTFSRHETLRWGTVNPVGHCMAVNERASNCMCGRVWNSTGLDHYHNEDSIVCINCQYPQLSSRRFIGRTCLRRQATLGAVLSRRQGGSLLADWSGWAGLVGYCLRKVGWLSPSTLENPKVTLWHRAVAIDPQ